MSPKAMVLTSPGMQELSQFLRWPSAQCRLDLERARMAHEDHLRTTMGLFATVREQEASIAELRRHLRTADEDCRDYSTTISDIRETLDNAEAERDQLLDRLHDAEDEKRQLRKKLAERGEKRSYDRICSCCSRE